MMDIILVISLFAGASRESCASPSVAQVSQLKRDAFTAYEAGDAARAVDLWSQAMLLYPSCPRTYAARSNLAIQVLNALDKVPADPRPCMNTGLRRARLARQAHAELLALPATLKGMKRAREKLGERLAQFPEAARDAAGFLDDVEAVVSPAAAIDRYSAAVSGFGVCPELRTALVRHVLAALPADRPTVPACDARTEAARRVLDDAMAALRRAESDATTTTEYRALAERRAQLDTENEAQTRAREQASGETDPDRAATTWASLAREMPTCAPHLAAKGDATMAAVAAWHHSGAHSLTLARRDELSRELLDVVLAQIEADHGMQARTLPEHATLTRSRAALVSPKPEPRRPPVVLHPKSGPATKPQERWISQHRPERNMLELGVFVGAMAPASGLINGTDGAHELFDGERQQQSMLLEDGGFYRIRPKYPVVT